MTSYQIPTLPLAIGHPHQEEDDPIGLNAWAASHGIQPSLALVLCGSLLSNLAGQTLLFNGDHGLSGMSGPSLAASSSDSLLRQALASLIADLEIKQRHLVQAAREFTVDWIDEVFHSRPVNGNSCTVQLEQLNSTQLK